MRSLFQTIIFPLVIVSLSSAAIAQDKKSPAGERAVVTASASTDRVRFTSPSSVVQMHLEVYNETAIKLFDFELKGGNVFDWHLQNGQAERIQPSSYLCVVTVKNLSGKLTQRFGTVNIADGEVTIDPIQASRVTAQQAQAIGPMEEESGIVVVLKEDEPLTGTVIAHNGEEGQIIRGRGALSFRLGDFFSGKDTEQMRLTAEGNLGIGITHPQVRLEVDGLIRASQGIVFPDGSVQYSAARKTLGAKSSRAGEKTGGKDELEQESLTATLDRIPKFMDGAGTLGDSIITESNSNIGIGTSSPAKKLHVVGGQIALDNGRFLYSRRTNNQFQEAFGIDSNDDIVFNRNSLVVGVDADAPKASSALIFGTGAGRFMDIRNSANATMLRAVEATGNVGIGTANPQAKLDVNGAGRFTPGGSGGAIQLGAPGGSETGMTIANASTRGELRFDGTTLKLVAGPSVGPPLPTNGIAINTSGFVGIGATNPRHRVKISGGPPWTTASWGGALELENGSAIGWRTDGAHVAAGIGVSGGNTYFFTAASEMGEMNGDPTYRLFIGLTGKVGVGTTDPAEKFHVVGNILMTGCLTNGTVVYAGSCLSDMRFKRQITPFPKLLSKVAQLQPVHFFWRHTEFPQRHFGAGQSYGLIAQEVEGVLPELVTKDDQGYKRVDYSKLPLLTIQAVKELKEENERLKDQNAAIGARLWRWKRRCKIC